MEDQARKLILFYWITQIFFFQKDSVRPEIQSDKYHFLLLSKPFQSFLPVNYLWVPQDNNKKEIFDG
jgi:hypothetical protein